MTEVETAKMSERGQIIIPKEIRDYVGAGESTIFTIIPLDRETIMMKKLDKKKLLEEFAQVRASVKHKMSEEEVKEEIMQYRKERRR